MAKDTFYFSHDYNARNDEKILELRASYGAEGYGIFWMIVETMAETENGGIKLSLIGGLSLGYGVAKDRLSMVINACLDLGLFYKSDDNEPYIFSKRLLTHKELRKSLSKNGSDGAKKRWGGDGGAIAPPMQRKGKENKGKIRGVGFSEDGKSVMFPDGTSQKLGEGQLLRMKEGNYEPHYVYQGIIE